MISEHIFNLYFRAKYETQIIDVPIMLSKFVSVSI